MNPKVILNPKMENGLTEFYQQGIQTRSYSDEEGHYAELILKKMNELKFDEAYIDATGNVVGRMGNGHKIIHFDSHMDTVDVSDGDSWISPPFDAALIDGYIHGRGSVDMKGGLSASVYAAALARDSDLLDGKTVYVTGTVCEEYCDGVSLDLFYQERNLTPNFCIICEPSDNMITLGHAGKLQARIFTHGVSAHGSAPEKGINAVYEMNGIIAGVEALNKQLSQRKGGGTIVLSRISSVAASLNAVPSECEIYLDRRLRLGETLEQAKAELDCLVEGKRADWEIGTLHHTSWKGAKLDYEPAHDPWKIPEDHVLVQKSNEAYERVTGENSSKYEFWDFGTNAVVPVKMGIPTIGFGPGEYKWAHMTNECCSLNKVREATLFYTELIGLL